VLNKAYLPWRDTSPSLENGAGLNRIVGVGEGRVAVVPGSLLFVVNGGS
jgi:hypothetical protein